MWRMLPPCWPWCPATPQPSGSTTTCAQTGRYHSQVCCVHLQQSGVRVVCVSMYALRTTLCVGVVDCSNGSDIGQQQGSSVHILHRAFAAAVFTKKVVHGISLAVRSCNDRLLLFTTMNSTACCLPRHSHSCSKVCMHVLHVFVCRHLQSHWQGPEQGG